jgi:hypothetical protein
MRNDSLVAALEVAVLDQDYGRISRALGELSHEELNGFSRAIRTVDAMALIEIGKQIVKRGAR